MPAAPRHRAAALLALALSLAGGGVAAQDTAAPPPGLVGPRRGAPVPVEDGTATVTLEATLPLEIGDRRLARFAFPETTAAPVLGPKRTGPGARRLRRLYAAGKAAGNLGDLYDNRDRGHSELPAGWFPQLARTAYAKPARQQGLDYGLATRMLFDAPLIGNSSTAVRGGPRWRSLPRLALTTPGGAGRLARNYASNALRIYPEHRDHDPEHGDLLPANTPYYLISQGSSGSDEPHMEALAMILAALRPETKRVAARAGVIAPLLQMVYRRARKGVLGRATYLSGAAHPSVFTGGGISLPRVVGLANAIAPEEVPGMVRLRVLEETQAEEGTDYFGAGLSETLFDTPSAIARIWRSRAFRREMVVSAAATRDPNGRDLSFEWRVLRGDPDRTRVEPLTEDGRRARITVEWQDARPVPGRGDIASRRVDIGVFADNGARLSAPGFVSVLLPRFERRVYEEGPDGAMRPAEIDRRRRGIYADPVTFPATPWRDRYRYTADGEPAGWLRLRADGREVLYGPDGRRHPEGPARRGEAVDYPIRDTARGGREIAVEAAPR